MDWRATTDRIVNICLQTFGTWVIYQPAEGVPYSIKGIFEASYQEVQSDGQVVQSTHPKLGVRVLDLKQTPQPGDKVLCKGTLYRVIEYQPDGQGGADIDLQEE